jgi:hypothetical protein
MQLHRLGKSLFGKAALASAALSGLLFFAGAPGAQAADRDDDHRRSVITDRHSDGDRGYYTRQADNWREERHETYEHRYPDYRDRDYRNNRDRDHNRDRDWNRNRDYNRYHRDRDRDRD